jgi:hypothetical protein
MDFNAILEQAKKNSHNAQKVRWAVLNLGFSQLVR